MNFSSISSTQVLNFIDTFSLCKQGQFRIPILKYFYVTIQIDIIVIKTIVSLNCWLSNRSNRFSFILHFVYIKIPWLILLSDVFRFTGRRTGFWRPSCKWHFGVKSWTCCLFAIIRMNIVIMIFLKFSANSSIGSYFI